VQPTPYQQQLRSEAELQQFQQQLRNPMSPGVKKKAAIAAVGGMSCLAVVLWLFALAGVGVIILIGLVIFSCSH
jgi:hypothetical protein